jgi:hypothetical protein
MLVETRNTANSFTAQCWIEGAAGFTDAGDPNSIGLAALTTAGRIIRTPPGIFVTPGLSISAFAADGTSAVVRFWWFDDVKALFVPFGATATLTTASTASTTTAVGCMPGAKFVCQVTTNTLVTKIAFMVR